MADFQLCRALAHSSAMNALADFYQNLGLALSLLVIATFIMAGLVKGVIGLGLPTVAMGLLGLAMAPSQAAALLIIPATLTTVWQLAFGGHLKGTDQTPVAAADDLPRTAVGTLSIGMAGGHWVVRGLGAALLLYALSGLLLPTLQVNPRHEPLGPLCGLITVITGHRRVRDTGGAVPAGAGFERDELVQALGLSFTVSTLALAGGLFWRGALGSGELSASLLVLIPAMLGMGFGQWLRQRISAAVQALLYRTGRARRPFADQRLADEALSMSIRRISKSRSRYVMRLSKTRACAAGSSARPDAPGFPRSRRR
jgi:uncharacterized membrane protein YfcA